MAFVKINSQPFPTVFANAINYYLKPHLYLWQQKKGTKDLALGTSMAPRTPESLLAGIPKLSESKLSDLAWSLDVKERIADRG